MATSQNVKNRFKPLSEADIRARTDDASFQKGQTYYLNHAIVEPTLRESTLQAYCHGSSGGPYRVEATLVPADEKKADWLASVSCDYPCAQQQQEPARLKRITG